MRAERKSQAQKKDCGLRENAFVKAIFHAVRSLLLATNTSLAMFSIVFRVTLPINPFPSLWMRRTASDDCHPVRSGALRLGVTTARRPCPDKLSCQTKQAHGWKRSASCRLHCLSGLPVDRFRPVNWCNSYAISFRLSAIGGVRAANADVSSSPPRRHNLTARSPIVLVEKTCAARPRCQPK